jgi:hypothetical protein
MDRSNGPGWAKAAVKNPGAKPANSGAAEAARNFLRSTKPASYLKKAHRQLRVHPPVPIQGTELPIFPIAENGHRRG